MTTRLDDHVVVAPNGMVTACGWCVSRARLEELARAYPAHVSHAMCPACVQRFEQGAA